MRLKLRRSGRRMGEAGSSARLREMEGSAKVAEGYLTCPGVSLLRRTGNDLRQVASCGVSIRLSFTPSVCVPGRKRVPRHTDGPYGSFFK